MWKARCISWRLRFLENCHVYLQTNRLCHAGRTVMFGVSGLYRRWRPSKVLCYSGTVLCWRMRLLTVGDISAAEYFPSTHGCVLTDILYPCIPSSWYCTVQINYFLSAHLKLCYVWYNSTKLPCVPLATEPGWLADRCSVSQQLGALQTHSFSFLTKRTYSCSNFVTISSLVLELLKKCRVRQRVGHAVKSVPL